MKKIFIITMLSFAGTAIGHPNATYRLDGKDSVTVKFEFVASCQVVPGAMSGRLRNLIFSEAAVAVPYQFNSGFYVETHIDDQEVYINTDNQCIPIDPTVSILASRNTFAGYSMQRISN